jgi:hypothetical protein
MHNVELYKTTIHGANIVRTRRNDTAATDLYR